MKIIVLIFLCAVSYVTASGVSKCYFCSDETCNDPFDTKNANIMSCSNPNSYRSAPGLKDWSEDVNSVLTKLNSSDTDNVCIKYRVKSQNTIRMCGVKKVMGQDYCDVIKQSGVVDTCKTCDSDLCNSASIFDMSLISTLVFLSLGYLLR